MVSKAVLLINLGTPDRLRPPEVRRYLRQFLSDPRVVDIPAPLRWMLLNLFILPFRPAASARAYAKVWTEEGSPLLVNSLALAEKLRGRLPADVSVEVAMRYGNPSIPAALERLLAGAVEEVLALPLYPQYASASTGSTVQALFDALARRWNVPPVRVLRPFFRDPGYIESICAVAAPLLSQGGWDFFLFSYHGLPERHIRRGEGEPAFCLKPDGSCCAVPCAANRYCYRAQCFETTRILRQRLGLPEGKCATSFQSRLGRTPWIGPYTDVMLERLAGEGVRNLLVFSPSFVADCLETLEEIGLRGKAAFAAAGGERLELVPSLNASEEWVTAVADLVKRHL